MLLPWLLSKTPGELVKYDYYFLRNNHFSLETRILTYKYIYYAGTFIHASRNSMNTFKEMNLLPTYWLVSKLHVLIHFNFFDTTILTVTGIKLKDTKEINFSYFLLFFTIFFCYFLLISYVQYYLKGSITWMDQMGDLNVVKT